MKFFIADEVDENSGYDMYLKLGVNDDHELAIFAYPTSEQTFQDEVEIGVFKDDGLHLRGCIDVVGWPVDKNGYIKIVRDA